MPLLSSAAAAAVGVALVTAGQLAVPAARPSIDSDPSSTSCLTAEAFRYLVLFEPGTDDDTARSAIETACGTQTVNYSEIGVAVATSADPRFDELLGADRVFSAERAARELIGPSALETDRDVSAAGSTRPATSFQVPGWAQRVATGSAEVLVGVLDSGIDAGHPALMRAIDTEASAGCLSGAPDRSAAAWTATRSVHGTHVAGIIGAEGADTSGVAPGVRLASIRVVDETGAVYPEAAVCGLLWAAAEGVDIANNSYIVDPWNARCTDVPGRAVATEAVQRAVRYASQQGVLPIAAAGNNASDLLALGRQSAAAAESGGDCRPLPAGLHEAVTVSAVGPENQKAGYSSYGLGVIDVAAPGGEHRRGTDDGVSGCISSTVPGGGYDRLCGTSMAAPYVSGVAALLASRHPEATPAGLRSMLRNQAIPLPCPREYDLNHDGTQDAECRGTAMYNSFYGSGLVNVLNAVRS
ncbi:S8 family peptidase [Actinoalloteichus hymeniacidonis]|uniref:Subtilase family protease n=1 Tax=Actinoalloteichus hymeniacidonis TaxID=340345 RepID=A0AAC9MXL0_9PSEU|nr:S8 family serine peptidase [Actinoalloteichus hymeniacidonis]AOS62444.1 subtilase family protease [Actinoalloteichus hymeniacidonis]MBB5909525.1 subtilisin family serine protease [Actinoalloteichus hymeniacidonis]